MNVSIRWALGSALFLCPGISRAAFNYFDPADTSSIPLLLSQTGIYADISGKVITPEAVFYEVNAPEWTDGAHKLRWILLPPGRSLAYNDTTDLLAFPDSTVFVQTFIQERIQNNIGSQFHWETRILMKSNDPILGSQWNGYTYKWRANQSEADLVSRDPFVNFFTSFTYTGGDGVLTYKKWKFPSYWECANCHRNGWVQNTGLPRDTTYARSVLGFMPVQLKRMAPLTATGLVNTNPNYNQVTYLFDRGVFSGQRPQRAALARRWKGMGESLPSASLPAERFSALDTMARSYIAANCSGCHGYRGLATGAMQGNEKNWDYYRLRAAVAMESVYTGNYGLNDTMWDTTQSNLKFGRQYYILSLQHAGMDMTPGTPWDMALPTSVEPATLGVTALYPGFPSLSSNLLRLWARRTPWNDSDAVYRNYLLRVQRICNPISVFYARCVSDSTIAADRLSWIFRDRWGSQPWLDTLNSHGYPLDSALNWSMAQYSQAEQMPPLATYLPDTAALKLLGEWVYRYGRSVVDIRKTPGGSSGGRIPFFRSRVLYLPEGWGSVRMLDMQGRKHEIRPLGKNAYALPQSVSPGVYFFHAGGHSFKASLL